MSGYCHGGHIVGRPLNRGKGVNFLPMGKHNDSARMLPCCPPDTNTALYNSADFTISFSDPMFFIIIFHITESRFISQGTNGTCPKGLTLAEDDLRIIMGLTLVFSGEIQVNIRLLVPLKAQEGLKGNIKSVLCQGEPAHRANFIRHIAACHTGKLFYLIRIKIIIMAGSTIVMRA